MNVPTSGDIAIRYLVAGRVQGVYYRAATADEAVRLGLRGWAKNLPDGRVEVVAAGKADALETLTTWLWRGPPAARVDAITIEQHADTVATGFTTR